MSNKEPGYVNILTRLTSGRLHTCKNSSFREDWVKIGKSSPPVDVRSKELDNTAVPLPFEIYVTSGLFQPLPVSSCQKVSKTFQELTKVLSTLVMEGGEDAE